MNTISNHEVAEILHIAETEVISYADIFYNRIKPCIISRYLSHLMSSIEDLINKKRVENFKDILVQMKHTEENKRIAGMIGHRNLRFYSIILIPGNLNRPATTRRFQFGASIYYNNNYDKKQIRLLIAHELGHIFNTEYLEQQDDERIANLFAYIAMKDKNDFYTRECKEFTFPGGDLQLLQQIADICRY